jgi:guanylate kinase
MMSAHKPLVYIISAPSGSGKSTLVNELLKRVPDLDFSISYTTRLPRGAEKNGKQYYFVSHEEFEKMIADDEFLEHASVFGHYYGTSNRFLRQAEHNGHDLLLDIDVQGAEQIKRKLPEAVSIFVLPPDRRTLEARLRKRSEDAERVIQRRLLSASREIEEYDKYNYVLINDNLADSVESLEAILQSQRLQAARSLANSSASTDENKIVALAERCRLANVRDRIQPILASFTPSVPSVPSASK